MVVTRQRRVCPVKREKDGLIQNTDSYDVYERIIELTDIDRLLVVDEWILIAEGICYKDSLALLLQAAARGNS
jgi:hypothetical protein